MATAALRTYLFVLHIVNVRSFTANGSMNRLSLFAEPGRDDRVGHVRAPRQLRRRCRVRTTAAVAGRSGLRLLLGRPIIIIGSDGTVITYPSRKTQNEEAEETAVAPVLAWTRAAPETGHGSGFRSVFATGRLAEH